MIKKLLPYAVSLIIHTLVLGGIVISPNQVVRVAGTNKMSLSVLSAHAEWKKQTAATRHLEEYHKAQTVSENPASAVSAPAAADSAAAAVQGSEQDIEAAQKARFYQELRDRLEERIVYPPQAVRRKLQGTVYLTLTVDEAGHLIALNVKRSSGHTVLDNAAVILVKSVLPLLHEPGRRLTVEIPISYALE